MSRLKRYIDRTTLWRIVLPALSTFGFFAVVLFLVMLPSVESRLMDEKRLQVKELVATAHANLAHHAAQEAAGALSRVEAQHQAIEHMRSVRYGPEGKDYFWINDMHPRMVMHPYRWDLEGRDISDYADPEGKRLFVESVQVVSESGAGYIEYMWQWKDDPTRVVPKISYVRAFEPWGWIIGSGIYIEDVRADLASTRRILIGVCGAVLLAIAILCAYLVWETHIINERRGRAERALQEEKAFSETVLESLPGIFYVYRMEGETAHLTRYNRNHVTATGYTDQEVRQMTPVDWFEGEEKEIALQAIQETLQQGESRVRQSVLYKDGSKVPYDLTGRRLDVGDGELYFLGVGLDISDSVATQEALRQSEERYHSLFQNASDAIFAIRGAGIIMCNAKTLEMFGCTQEQILGHTPGHWSPAFQPDGCESAGRAEERIGAALGGERQVFEWVHRRYDGTLFDAEVSLNGIELDGDACVLAIVRDISGRKRTEAELERFALVIEQAEEMVVITDTGGNTTYVNPAFEEVTGYTREEVIGENPRILKSGEMDDSVYRDLWETLTRGETWTGRFVNRRKNGTLFTEDATISPLRSASGDVVSYVAVKRDVSRELELEEQFFQAQKMEAVGQLAGGVAHDFNNLLQIIQGYGELVLMDLDTDSKMYEGLTQVMEAADRARTLVRQLLAFSRKQVLELEDVDLGEVVGNLAKMIQRVIGADVSFNTHSKPGLKLVRADKGQLEQILMNLCVNGRDAMPEGGVLTVETENVSLDEEFCMANDWAKPGRYVALSVSDTGSGMDEDTQRRIFEPFFTTKELGKGTGLGLSTVFGIIRQHNGMVHVYSETGMGTTFRIYLPMLEGGRITVEEEEAAPPPGGTETILVADDDRAVCAVAETILTRAGYTVLTAFDGEEAIRVFDEHAAEIDLALLDVVMPNLGGEAVAKHIRETHPETPTLFASGYSAEAVHTGYILDKGVRLVQKPYHRVELLRRVREVLDG
ncbi:MAG: PAS domain S-box protein [bacterium]|nr:PAS domain S-box protein [bacterium]